MEFLEKLAEFILDKTLEEQKHLIVILPNVRARLFLNEHLKNKAKKAMFFPIALSSKELMEKISGLKMADDYLLLSMLYKAYQKEEKEDFSFDIFMNWGNSLLQDLKEIDHQLVDAKKLFSDLNDMRRLEFWDPQHRNLSDFQKKYLGFCSKLPNVYQNFTYAMESEGISHAGYIERKSFENLNENLFSKKSKVIIAGFNALSKSEDGIFKFISDHFETTTFYDYDHYYVDNIVHEAGHFARINQKNSSEPLNWISNDFIELKKNISTYKCATNYEQALVVAELLKELKESTDLKKTAVVLADESMLLPVLQCLPDKIKEVNVTMGYPLIHSPYFSLFESLIKLGINAKKNKGESTYYYKDILRLLNSDVIKDHNTELVSSYIKELNANKNIFIPITEFISFLFQLIGLEGFDVKDLYTPVDIVDLLKRLIVHLDNQLLTKNELFSKLNREFLLHHYEVAVQVEKMLLELKEKAEFIVFHKIWRHYTQLSKVQFTGEPLLGLQIMGLLESRNLDFDRVIILNTNEGTLPSSKKYGSLIPNDLKNQYGMHLHKEKDAVFSYHFYRLLQRTERMDLLYSSQIDVFGGGEKSRYLIQLQKELPELNVGHILNEITVSGSFNFKPNQIKKINKSQVISRLIKEKLTRGLSPTSISSFINCPLNFYYTELVGLRENNELIEKLESDIMGRAIHNTMESIYIPLKNKILNVSDIKEMQKNFGEILKLSYLEYISEPFLLKGKNLLLFEMSKKMIARFLAKELIYVQENEVQIIDLELKLEHLYVMDIYGEEVQIKIKGVIDRVEKRNGQWHLIDYKSGMVKSKDLVLDHPENILEGHDKVIQLITYALLYAKTHGIENDSISASIYPFKSYKSGYLPLKVSGNNSINQADFQWFTESLNDLIGMIMNPDIPFAHNIDAKYCVYC